MMNTLPVLTKLKVTVQRIACYISATCFWFYRNARSFVCGKQCSRRSPTPSNQFVNLFQACNQPPLVASVRYYPSDFERVASYNLPHGVALTVVVGGSLADFKSTKGAIISGCDRCLNNGLTLGGSQHVFSAADFRLICDRLWLNLFEQKGDGSSLELDMSTRCCYGDARRSGPGRHGNFKVPYIIHAVGPDFRGLGPLATNEATYLLRDAYRNALECTTGTDIDQVAISLLCTGAYGDNQNLTVKTLFDIPVDEIFCFTRFFMENSMLKDIFLFADSHDEARLFLKSCDERFKGYMKVQKVE